MTTQEHIDILKQTVNRLNEVIYCHRCCLATVLANPNAYTPGAAEDHVDSITKIINGQRARQAHLREKIKELTP